MDAEAYPVSLVNRFSLPQSLQVLPGYYRSKLFIAPSTTNPLVAAAGPLFSLLERICMSPILPSIQTIRDNIEHELQAFHCRVMSQTYAEELITIAHYLLCATIDELLGKNYLRVYGQVQSFKSFTPISANDIGPERRFFEILQYVKERPSQFLDVIELAYYCLITGFEGQYHLKTDGRYVLDHLTEELFQLIQRYRVNKSYRLFKEPPPAPMQNKSYRALYITLTFSLCLPFAVYFLSHYFIEQKATIIFKEHASLVNLDHE